MLSKQYAAERAKLIDMEHANCEVGPGTPVPSAGDTTYLSVVDREGNMVSLIESNYAEFGSGLVADGTGFVLHDRGALFSLDPASPNAIAGHKRPLHTIIPAFMEKDQIRIAFGIMGGWNQAQAHAQFVSHVVDFNQNIQAALETARFTKPTFTGCDVQLENRVPGNVKAELEAKGHKLIDAQRLFGCVRRRAGGDARLRNRRELWSVRPAERRRGHPGIDDQELDAVGKVEHALACSRFRDAPASPECSRNPENKQAEICQH